MINQDNSQCPSLPKMMGYSLGECANSLVMNGIFGFAMLYYTKALGLNPGLAGIAMSVCVGMVLVSSLQMYVYDDFMKFPAGKKTIAHGSTMIGFAIGAFLSVILVLRLDKKGTVLLGGCLSVLCNIVLALLFLTGIVPKDSSLTLPLFVLFHAGYWMGNGMLLPISTAMMADIAEIHLLQSGENKDGAYSSVFSLAMRLAISFSMIFSGWCLTWTGYQVPKAGETVTQTPQALWNLGMTTFVVGAVIATAALLAIWLYPVNRKFLKEMRAKAGTVKA